MHKPGKDNVVFDALSQKKEYQDEKVVNVT
jgi:hypothetical protein